MLPHSLHLAAEISTEPSIIKPLPKIALLFDYTDRNLLLKYERAESPIAPVLMSKKRVCESISYVESASPVDNST
jgi:hypothetical protein